MEQKIKIWTSCFKKRRYLMKRKIIVVNAIFLWEILCGKSYFVEMRVLVFFKSFFHHQINICMSTFFFSLISIVLQTSPQQTLKFKSATLRPKSHVLIWGLSFFHHSEWHPTSNSKPRIINSFSSPISSLFFFHLINLISSSLIQFWSWLIFLYYEGSTAIICVRTCRRIRGFSLIPR